jgi:hypothetical protein
MKTKALDYRQKIIERIDFLLLFSFFSIILAPFGLGIGISTALAASSSLISGLLHLALMGILLYHKEDLIPYAKNLRYGKQTIFLLLLKSLICFLLSFNLFFLLEFALSLLYLLLVHRIQQRIKLLCLRNQILFC